MTLTLREKLKLCLIHLWHLMLDRRAVGVLILKSIVVLSGRRHLIFISEDKLQPKLAGDVVDDGLCEWDVGVLGHAFRFEADVAEFFNQGFEGDAVLEAERDVAANGVYQAVHGGAVSVDARPHSVTVPATRSMTSLKDGSRRPLCGPVPWSMSP